MKSVLRNIVVVLVESAPSLPRVGNRNFLEFFSFLNKHPEEDGSILWPSYYKERGDHVRSSISEYIDSRSQYYYLPIADLFLQEEMVVTGRGRKVYYLDDNHLTYAGTNLARERFNKAIDSLLNEEPFPFSPPEEN